MSRVVESWNSNGLVGGSIPAGKPCPFLSECSFRNDECPTSRHPRDLEYSCASARALSLIRLEER